MNRSGAAKGDSEMSRMKKRWAYGLAMGIFLVLSGAARTSAAQGRVVTISEVTIVGRVQKPIAAVDVSRIQPKLTLTELRRSFVHRIERALYRAPF